MRFYNEISCESRFELIFTTRPPGYIIATRSFSEHGFRALKTFAAGFDLSVAANGLPPAFGQVFVKIDKEDSSLPSSLIYSDLSIRALCWPPPPQPPPRSIDICSRVEYFAFTHRQEILLARTNHVTAIAGEDVTISTSLFALSLCIPAIFPYVARKRYCAKYNMQRK